MPQSLRDYRRQRGWSQRACANALHVTANTVARWERGEVRVPPWVAVIVDVWTQAAEQSQAALDRARMLEEQAAEQSQAALDRARMLEERATVLKATITRLELQNLALEHRLRQKRERRPRASATGTSSLKAERIYKDLVRRYHPDRNPASAEVMRDINTLWQAVRR